MDEGCSDVDRGDEMTNVCYSKAHCTPESGETVGVRSRAAGHLLYVSGTQESPRVTGPERACSPQRK